MKAWLSGIVGESAANIVGFILVFAIILGGIFVVLSIIRRFSSATFTSSTRARQPRLSVMDAAAVDGKRKLVLIRRDDVEHLLLIGGPTDVVVEQNIVMETRNHARLHASRIEPEHIERFKQHEAALTNEKGERPALSLQPAQAEEKDETIQLTSAIDTPAYRTSQEEPVQPAASPVRASPQSSAVPASRRPDEELKSSQPAQPRPTPNHTPQPRTVLPPRPVQSQPQSPRAHPAYPLSQVSRGVLSSTSSGATASVAVAASVTAANLGSIVPEREAAATGNSPRADITGQKVSSATAPAINKPAEGRRVEPQIALTEPATEAAEAATTKAPAFNLTDLDEAISEAISAEVNSPPPASDTVNDIVSFDNELFENELLSSLDISAADDFVEGDTKNDIEGEMEKLLGELSRDDIRRS